MKNIPVPIAAIDFEGSRALGIVEYGIAEFFGGELVGAHTRICRPKTDIPARDSEFFDITDGAAKVTEPFSKDIDLFVDLRGRCIFAAHNASVEDSLLRAELPTPAEVCNFVTGEKCLSWAPWLDSFVFCKNLFPSVGSAKLSDVVEALAIAEKLNLLAEKFCPEGRRKWHCALYDAIACGLIYEEVCAMRGFENVTLPWLAKYSGVRNAEQRDFGF